MVWCVSGLERRSPYHAPNANAFAERSIRTVRDACLDHLFILNASHLRRVLVEYVTYYNEAGPPCANEGAIRCREVLVGLIHDYYREAA